MNKGTKIVVHGCTEEQAAKLLEILQIRPDFDGAYIYKEEEEVTYFDLTYKPNESEFHFQGKEIYFPPGQKIVLTWFFRNPDRVGTRPDLMNLVYGKGHNYIKRNIDTILKRIRKILKDNALEQLDKAIKSVHGEGYKLKTK